MSPNTSIPVVLGFSGSDPTGGAGIQADIETAASHGCHLAPVITAVTVQDTRTAMGFTPMDPSLVADQARAVFRDMPVATIKIGMLGSIGTAEAIAEALEAYSTTPVILDPVLAAGGGGDLAETGLAESVATMLVPRTTILTPNRRELRRLAPEGDSPEACAMALLERGCRYVLVKGGDEPTPTVTNALYGRRGLIERFSWDRLPDSFHGSGCTLATSIAALLARGLDPFDAVNEAQAFTWETLKHAYRLGMGQRVPNRLFWARDDDADE